MIEKTEAKKSYTYPYPHPAVTVDCVVFGLDATHLRVLLIQRKVSPFAGEWALPGGFVGISESLEDAARRELREETGVKDVFLEQFSVFGDPDRDPRERVISVAYFVLVKPDAHILRADTDASDAAWFPLNKLPKLAFDHGRIVAGAIQRLREKIQNEPVGFELLPLKFKLPQLQRLYETILERPLDKRNFRRRIITSGLLVSLRDLDRSEKRRPARLFRFNVNKYEELKKKGLACTI